MKNKKVRKVAKWIGAFMWLFLGIALIIMVVFRNYTLVEIFGENWPVILGVVICGGVPFFPDEVSKKDDKQE